MLVPIKRVRFMNRPATAESMDFLRRQVSDFITIDKKQEFSYEVLFNDGENGSAAFAIVRVFYPYPHLETAYPDKVGVYQASELKRFEADIKRVTMDNPTGDVELSENELYNGLFNAMGNKLDGWEIEADNTGGGLTITSKNDRLVISSTGVGSFIIANTKTVLKNLIEYDTLLYMSDVIGDANANIAIGVAVGGSYNAQGSYPEYIIAGGSDFMIQGNIVSPGAEIVIDYIIVNGG
jgi:hypothetical protein